MYTVSACAPGSSSAGTTNSASKSPLMSVATTGGGTHRCPSPITTCLKGVNPLPEMLTAPSLGLAIAGLELLLKHFMNRFDL